MEPEDNGESGGRPCKVARLLAEYDLPELGEELERRWTADGDERASLRELANLFNRRLLEVELANSGVHALAGEAANHYRLLTDDDVGGAPRTRARRRLEREGVDVDNLEAAFVSYQAIRTYLVDHRGVSYDADTDPVAGAADTVARLQGRLASVTESKLEAARRADALALGGYDVTVSVRVDCRDCGRQVGVGRLLEEGGCNCQA